MGLRAVATATITVVFLCSGVGLAQASEPTSPSPTPSATPTEPAPQDPAPTPTPSPTTECRGVADTRVTTTQRSKPFTVCGVAVLSRHHRVTKAYRPKLVSVAVKRNGISGVRLQSGAAKALKAMFAKAKKSGHTLVVRSAYRSYATQARLYRTDHVLTAMPGASEHQSGLAVDLAAIRKGRLVRGYGFGSSAAGNWVRRHAAEYGFILRYPNHQKAITGIPNEPWHFRYVGVKVAQAVVKTKTKTLERYLQIRS